MEGIEPGRLVVVEPVDLLTVHFVGPRGHIEPVFTIGIGVGGVDPGLPGRPQHHPHPLDRVRVLVIGRPGDVGAQLVRQDVCAQHRLGIAVQVGDVGGLQGHRVVRQRLAGSELHGVPGLHIVFQDRGHQGTSGVVAAGHVDLLILDDAVRPRTGFGHVQDGEPGVVGWIVESDLGRVAGEDRPPRHHQSAVDRPAGGGGAPFRHRGQGRPDIVLGVVHLEFGAQTRVVVAAGQVDEAPDHPDHGAVPGNRVAGAGRPGVPFGIVDLDRGLGRVVAAQDIEEPVHHRPPAASAGDGQGGQPARPGVGIRVVDDDGV